MSYRACDSLLFASGGDRGAEGILPYHVSVMSGEVLDILQPGPGMVILDGTLGGGGHSRALLQAGAQVIGMDRDPEALQEAGPLLSSYEPNFRSIRGNFCEAEEALNELGLSQIDGALLDLGVSSHQLDTATRGFSFQKDGPLDMRMDLSEKTTAADLVNHASFEELIRIFRDYGEEPKAARIASRIINVRAKKPFTTTLELASAVESVVRRTGPKHAATRVFQALRIAVNEEIASLAKGLEVITRCLKPGGVFAVISFHSLEDRTVKQFFRDGSNKWIDRPEWPEPRKNPLYQFEKVTSGPMVASPEEIAKNPRARSAKLRAVRKLWTHHEP
jgi:16S rRNA (cytosine1402-N4)-methyltransferase